MTAPTTSAGSLAFGWCELRSPQALQQREDRLVQTLREEALGYFAMLAFLIAYLLSQAGMGHIAQAALNFIGAAVGAVYLLRKHAVPSVISNLAWGAITLVGLIIQHPF
jgi:hypothetical protein